MKYIVISLFIILFSACSTKLTIKSLKPAKVSDSDIKQVSVKRFKNDNVGLSNTISAKMKSINFNGKNYFNVINRDILNEILKEQRLQDSGIVNNKKDIEALADVRSIVTGEILSKNYTKQYYYERRTDYKRCISYKYLKNKKRVCSAYRVYNHRCENHQYDLSASIFINKITNAKTIYSRNFDEHKTINRCDYTRVLSSKHQIFKSMVNNITNKFIKDITPSYEYRTVEVLDQKDISYTTKQSKLLDKAIENIEKNNIKNANKLLKELVYSTKERSYTALYNLALTFEYLDELNDSLVYYNKAKHIKQNNKYINKAIIRVTQAISKKDIANKQINK